jgi:hypothetical protein
MFFILFFEKVGRAGGRFFIFYFLFSVANHRDLGAYSYGWIAVKSWVSRPVG